MKKTIFLILIAATTFSVCGQKLADIYKSGTVKLVPDASYAQGNDWNTVFRTYFDTLYKTAMGGRKSLIVMPDGSVVVNHAYRNYYTRFLPSGKFEKEFGILNSKGIRYKKTNAIKGIAGGNTYYTNPDNMGNSIFFDFDGNYKNTLKINYMVRQMITLPGNKIAVVGWVLWKDRTRDFVSIIDYETNSEKVIWEHFTTRPEQTSERKLFTYSYTFKYGGAMGCRTMPFSDHLGISTPPQIQVAGNKLVIGIPITGEILIHDLDGKLVSKDKMEVTSNFISVEEQKEIQKKAIEKYTNMRNTDDEWILGMTKTRINMLADSPEKEAALKDVEKIAKEQKNSMLDSFLKEMESDLNKISEPIRLPAFSTVIKDSDDNLLFFEYAREANANKFHVWIFEKEGKFVCESSFECDDYKLEINPSKIVFNKGYIYGLQLLKDSTGVPLRLVRFKLTGS